MSYKFHWFNPKIEPRETGRYGTGLFAREPITKNERLIVLGGYILTVEEESQLPGKCSDNGVQITEDLVISITKEEEYNGVSLINHSCTPNAGFKGQIFIVAMRDIAPEEEISIDYAMVLHTASEGPRYSLDCQCGQAECRHTITDEDWQNPELQHKYNGYFQYFIQEKIDNA